MYRNGRYIRRVLCELADIISSSDSVAYDFAIFLGDSWSYDSNTENFARYSGARTTTELSNANVCIGGWLYVLKRAPHVH